jgi:hypothetical protein
MPGVFEAVEYSAVFLIGGAVAWALGFHLIGATFASASLQGVGLVIIERGRENSRIRRARQDFARRVYKMRGDYCRNSLARVAL